MKVLVIGSGGREHALVWKIKQSPRVTKVYCAPGNAGIGENAILVPIKTNDLEGLLAFVVKEDIELTVVGPEEPLTKGIVDLFESKGRWTFGANRRSSLIEGSKVFAKEMMKTHNIPTAKGSYAATFSGAMKLVEKYYKVRQGVVVKADGLCGGKGVYVCQSMEEAEKALDEIMIQMIFGEAGDLVVIEERLSGQEASFVAFANSLEDFVLPMASSQDHKAVFNQDLGPNTGGMGAYSPAPVVTPDVCDRIMQEIMYPTIRAMKSERRPFRGVLYAGVMIRQGKPKVLEFNCRFGDPETQPVLMRMKDDIIPIIIACIDGNLHEQKFHWDQRASACVVMTTSPYPDNAYKKNLGKTIFGLNKAGQVEGAWIFHAGTKRVDGVWKNDGGRVLGVTAMADKGIDDPVLSIFSAVEHANCAVYSIFWPNEHHRTDIGGKAKWFPKDKD